MHNYAFILPSMKSVSEMALIMHNLCDESLEKCLVVFPLPYQRLMQSLGLNGFVASEKKWNKYTDFESYIDGIRLPFIFSTGRMKPK